MFVRKKYWHLYIQYGIVYVVFWKILNSVSNWLLIIPKNMFNYIVKNDVFPFLSLEKYYINNILMYHSSDKNGTYWNIILISYEKKYHLKMIREKLRNGVKNFLPKTSVTSEGLPRRIMRVSCGTQWSTQLWDDKR